MLSCWCFTPGKRPKFNVLGKMISQILGEIKSEHYINLNEPYLEANANRFNSDQIDYLALLPSPNCQAPCVPLNVAEGENLSFLINPRNEVEQPTKMFHAASNTFEISNDSVALETFKTNDFHKY